VRLHEGTRKKLLIGLTIIKGEAIFSGFFIMVLTIFILNLN
jgi:hypothetical protein